MPTEKSEPDLSLLPFLMSHPQPEVLYHYTSIEGLLGIIEKKEIWASHIMYMNDALEFKLFIDLLDRGLKPLLKQSDIPTFKVLDACCSIMSRSGSQMNVCVVSFSEIRDALDQWRGYGGSSTSFCIGFSFNDLSQIAANLTPAFSLLPCAYEPKVQRKLITDFIFRAKGKADDLRRAICYAPIFKDAAFRNEVEWRLHATIGNPSKLCFRPGKSMVVPYFKFPLDGAENLAIKEVVVGPTPNKELSVSSVEALLKNNKIIAEVKPSAIPFRNW